MHKSVFWASGHHMTCSSDCGLYAKIASAFHWWHGVWNHIFLLTMTLTIECLLGIEWMSEQGSDCKHSISLFRGCICSIDSCLITDCYNVSCANHKLFVDFHWELLYFQTLYNMLWEGEGRDLPSFIHSIRTSDITDNMLHDCNMNLFLFVCVCVFSCMCLCVCAFVSLGLCPYSATCNHPDYSKTHQCRHTNVHARTHTLQ